MNKILKTQFSVTLIDTFQVFKIHMWLEATTLDGTDIKLFHHYRKFNWTTLLQKYNILILQKIWVFSCVWYELRVKIMLFFQYGYPVCCLFFTFAFPLDF